jgi:hypothetical protein
VELGCGVCGGFSVGPLVAEGTVVGVREAGRPNVEVTPGVRVAVCALVADLLGVAEGVVWPPGVAVRVRVGVRVGVAEAWTVAVAVRVAVRVRVAMRVGVADATCVAVDVRVGVGVAEAVVAVAVGSGVSVGEASGLGVSVAVGVGVSSAVGCPTGVELPSTVAAGDAVGVLVGMMGVLVGVSGAVGHGVPTHSTHTSTKINSPMP